MAYCSAGFNKLSSKMDVATNLRGALLAIGPAVLLVLVSGLLAVPAQAQQQVAYIDSEYVLEQMPEYASVDQELERMAQEWEAEIQELEDDLKEMREEYQARELLFTEREQEERRAELEEKEAEIDALRQQYFGPDGQLYQEQQQLLRPIQERVLDVVEQLASERDYDYVFDKGGDFLFLYASDQHDLSDAVLRELGIDID